MERMKKLFGLVLLLLAAGIAPCMAEHWVQWYMAEGGVAPYFYLLGDQTLGYTDKAGVEHRYQLNFAPGSRLKESAGYAVLTYAGATDITLVFVNGETAWRFGNAPVVKQFFAKNAGYVIADVDSGYAARIFNGTFESCTLVEVH